MLTSVVVVAENGDISIAISRRRSRVGQDLLQQRFGRLVCVVFVFVFDFVFALVLLVFVLHIGIGVGDSATQIQLTADAEHFAALDEPTVYLEKQIVKLFNFCINREIFTLETI